MGAADAAEASAIAAAKRGRRRERGRRDRDRELHTPKKLHQPKWLTGGFVEGSPRKLRLAESTFGPRCTSRSASLRK